jgi:ABC-type uncharacterized transport system permease subunit
MAQLEFKYSRRKLLWSAIKVNWRQETAYFANAIFGLITPLMYGLSFLIFVEVLYRNIDSVAGYGRNEMFLLVFLGQLVFYVYEFWGATAAYEMERDVNNGAYDYLLTKPVPALFYTTIRRIKPLRGLINFMGPLLPPFLVVDWGVLNIGIIELVVSVIMVILSALLYHQAQFIVSLISFWTGRGKQASLLVYAASSQSIPFEGFPTPLKGFLLFILPVYYSSVVASVLLGRSNAVFWFLTTCAVAVIFSALKRYTWAKAIRQYSSASS